MLVRRLWQADSLEDLCDVGLDRAFRDEQPRGDGPVRHAFGYEPEDLSFPLGQSGDRSSRRRRPRRRETIVGSITVSPSTIRRNASTTVTMSNTRSLRR
jgi:hypothetical protein